MNNSVERTNLLRLLNAGLESVQGRQAVRCFLTQHSVETTRLAVLAIGKAAYSMLEGAVDVLGENINRALVITKDGHAGQLDLISGLECLFSSHPVPDERSLVAGDRLISWLLELPAGLPLLVLISGGTSSLVEKLPEGVGLAKLQKLNHWLLASGMTISEMNRLRRSVSLIKGGRLLDYIGERQVTQLLISDVPGDDPAIIGSGLLVADKPSRRDMLEPPDWLNSMQHQAAQESVAQAHKPQINTAIVASNRIACEAIARLACELGYKTQIVSTGLTTDVHSCAEEIVEFLKQATPGCYIWGGEPTLQLPASPGRGGRNQHLALLLAQQLQDNRELTVLCAGTDGTDGPTNDAGALVDSQTIDRGRVQGFDVNETLSRADAGAYLEASSDLINTGPTGTNVMDVVIALKG